MLLDLDGKTQMMGIGETSRSNGLHSGLVWRVLFLLFMALNGILVFFLYLFDLL